MAGRWHKAANDALVGRRITAVRWMSEAEVEAFGWNDAAIVLELDDGGMLIPQMDDEGNNAGALWQLTKTRDEHIWPVGVKEREVCPECGDPDWRCQEGGE